MSLRIGLSRVDITPPVGVELAGFGPYLRRRSTHRKAPIYARAIAVDNGSARWVLASCDLLGLSQYLVEQVVSAVVAASGWSPDQIVVHCTHNHSGPGTIVENVGWGEPDHLYLAQLPALITQACLDAVGDLGDARIGHTDVALDRFAHNRMLPRRGLTNELALADAWAEPDPASIDTTVHVLRIDRAAQLYGFVVYYSCHPVVCSEQTTGVHGDFPGEALRLLEQQHPGATGIFLQGALGDINPLYAHGEPEESYEAMAVLGSRLARAVAEGIDSAEPDDADAVQATRREVAYELAPYAVDELRSRRDEAAAVVMSTPPDHQSRDKAMAAVVYNSLTRTLAKIESGRETRRPIYVQALALGPLTMIGFNLEVFHGIKRRLQAEFGPQCLVLSTTNGWLGYAPTREAYAATAIPYAARHVPIIAGHLPFNSDIEDTLVQAGRAAHDAIAAPAAPGRQDNRKGLHQG